MHHRLRLVLVDEVEGPFRDDDVPDVQPTDDSQPLLVNRLHLDACTHIGVFRHAAQHIAPFFALQNGLFG